MKTYRLFCLHVALQLSFSDLRALHPPTVTFSHIYFKVLYEVILGSDML